LGLPTQLKKPLSKEVLKALLGLDKKIRGGKVQFVLPKRIGEVIIASDVPLAELDSVLEGIGCK
jgi:3-dehydroquinate synthase